MQFWKVTFHLQLFQNIGYIPCDVQYILEPTLNPIVFTSHFPTPKLPCTSLVTTRLSPIFVNRLKFLKTKNCVLHLKTPIRQSFPLSKSQSCVCVCVCVSNCKIKSTLLRHLFIFHLFNVVNQDIILISHMRKLRSFEVKQLTWEMTLNIKMRILDQVICIQVPDI